MSRNRDVSHDELVDHIRTHAIWSGTTDPNADVGEFAAFDSVLADVRVIGLGEATHRTREFVRLKHRFFRYLVEHHGVRLFGLEAPFSETMALHDYVVHGHGNLDAILDRIGFRIYETEEMVAFLRWLRDFNERRPPSDRIEVYGFDVQSAVGPAEALLSSFDDPSVSPPPDDVIGSLSSVAKGVFEGEDVNEERLRRAEAVVSTLAGRFESKVDVGSDDANPDPSIAKQHWRTLQRACEFARTGMEADRSEQWGLRDRYMAETVAWILDHADANRIAVWAHDNHVKRGRLTGDGHPSKTMGEHLASRYGDGYHALGGQFGQGTVRAWVPTDGDGEIEVDGRDLSMTEIPVPEPIEGAIPAVFSDLGDQVVLLEFRSLPDDGRLGRWLGEERSHHFVAGVVDPDDRRNFYRDYAPVQAFDGLFFVREASPTTPR
ncbi:MAG: erythromycin esterase family protein [Halobacteriales archaeon]